MGEASSQKKKTVTAVVTVKMQQQTWTHSQVSGLALVSVETIALLHR
jgi:hypothetical protein